MLADRGQAEEIHDFVVTEPEDGLRLDVFVHRRLPVHSRTYLKDLVRTGLVTVDGQPVKPALKVEVGMRVRATVRPRPEPGEIVPQKMPLSILYEDASLVVIDKPSGLVVHPGNGRQDGTLVNALAHHFQDALSDVGGAERPGIVHRLDRETSGVMVVAKTNRAHYALSAQFQERTTQKRYLAICEGAPALDGDVIDAAMARSRRDPAKMAVDPEGKAAVTRYEVLERYPGFSYLSCWPKTGRTHQIRVHLKSIGHPICCDALYGRRRVLSAADLGGASSGVDETVLLERHALHARSLAFDHPLLGRRMEFEAALPPDMEAVLEVLRHQGSVRNEKGRR